MVEEALRPVLKNTYTANQLWLAAPQSPSGTSSTASRYASNAASALVNLIPLSSSLIFGLKNVTRHKIQTVRTTDASIVLHLIRYLNGMRGRIVVAEDEFAARKLFPNFFKHCGQERTSRTTSQLLSVGFQTIL
ncbi:hypothetical protein EVAR_5529_1 [Eumeta japonica]|uniref:Uncharacterized protein n=1 Tax=Eumeta variegata TaxID=151549 RepID=A0A4C1TA12_EUMVA|nr:hypothetical protein EVAR_5529_1 [Eumeta japonica]